MKRIISLLAAMGLMAAMLAASAMPALADKGGGGHSTNEGGCSDFSPTTGYTCDITSSNTGRSEEPGGVNGRESEVSTVEFTFVEYHSRTETSTQGGGKGIKGGNCTSGFTNDNLEYNPIPVEGNGPRCN